MKPCRLCRQPALTDPLDLGPQSPSNRFLLSPTGGEYAHPLVVAVCAACGLVQLDDPMPVAEVRPRFDWITYNEPEGHLDDVAERIRGLPGVGDDSFVLGLSYLDDSTLRRLADCGMSSGRRLDLHTDLGVTASGAGVESIQERLTPDMASALASRHGPAQVVVARYVLEHAHDTIGALAALRGLAAPGGFVVLEVPDVRRALETGEYSVLWEEHAGYFTPNTLHHALGLAGLEPVSLTSYPYPVDNALVAIARVPHSKQEVTLRPDRVAAEVRRARRFLHDFPRRKRQQQEAFSRESRRGKVALLGAGHLSVAYLNFFELAPFVAFVVDDHPRKQGLFMPGSRLPILGSAALLTNGVRLCLMSVRPEAEDAVVARNKAFLAAGGVLRSLFRGSPYARRAA